MKTNRILSVILLVVQLLLPICRLIAYVCGYVFTLYNNTAYCIGSTLLTLVLTIVLFRQDVPVNWVEKLIYLLLLPAALLNGLLWIPLSEYGVLNGVLALVNGLCNGVLLWHQAGKEKIFSFIVSLPLALCILYGCYLMILFGGVLVKRTVVQKLASPQGGYSALVIDYGQGALGGDMGVTVRRNQRFSMLFGYFSCPYESIYTGDWEELASIEVIWLNEQTLLIDGLPYSVEGT